MHVIRLILDREVFCDICNNDFTDSDEQGGFLFQFKAICPKCEPKQRAAIEQYKENHLIRDECPEGVSFADWVRGIR